MKNYLAIYEDKTGNIASNAYFNANNLREAKAIAQFHKRHTHEIACEKGIKTIVKPYNNKTYEC